MEEPPEVAVHSALKTSIDLSPDVNTVAGYDFNKGVDYHSILESYKRCGFQATNFGFAVEEINKMVIIWPYF